MGIVAPAEFHPGREQLREGYDPADFPRDFADDVEALRTLYPAKPPTLGDIHRWLDGRDRYPSFTTERDTRAYLDDRDRHAAALHVVLVLGEPLIHSPFCEKRNGRSPCNCDVWRQ